VSEDPRASAFWGNVGFQLQLTQGAPTSGAIWDTDDYRRYDPYAAEDRVSEPNLWVPDHGLKIRFACTSARLRIVSSAWPASVQIFASLTPCSGMQTCVIPSVVPSPILGSTMLFGSNPAHPCGRLLTIPKGASEMRVVPSAAEEFAIVGLYGSSSGSLGGAQASQHVADWYDWRGLPGAAYFVELYTRGATSDPALRLPVYADIYFR
jgi:hypothetical protein